jgi:TonB family protein
MTNSRFCVRQRQQEQQRLNKLLILGFAGSTVLHGILAYTLPRWSFEPPKTAEEPMELILVDKPKPQPKPQPKIESKPIVEPKPKTVKPPEPVKEQTPPPPVKPPEPVQTQTPPPKPAPKPPEPEPAPKKVLTTPAPAPNQPIVSAPVEKTPQPSSLRSNFTAPNSSVTSAKASSDSPNVPATNSPPSRPEASSEPPEGISCVSNCEPEYPDTLEGVEGSAGIKLTIDPDGNVVGVELANADSNSQVNREALLAARQMQFSSPGDDVASVQVKIDFTVEGSEYDRARREEQERKEQAAKEQQEIEAARQQQLEAERQAQQQLEQERQARQQQQEVESQPQTESETQSAPKPLPALSKPPFAGKQELEQERLRKFQERMENYRQ